MSAEDAAVALDAVGIEVKSKTSLESMRFAPKASLTVRALQKWPCEMVRRNGQACSLINFRNG